MKLLQMSINLGQLMLLDNQVQMKKLKANLNFKFAIKTKDFRTYLLKAVLTQILSPTKLTSLQK